MKNEMDIIQVGDVLLSIDCFRERCACDLGVCRGACCVEGNAGAPVTLEEIMAIEDALPEIEGDFSEEARRVIATQGVAYSDPEGDLVTSLVGGKDCVFTCYDKHGTCLCAIERAQREGRITTAKPLSCWLYPLRVKRFKSGITAVNYHRWDICRPAEGHGEPLYRYLKEPLVRRFGQAWYDELIEQINLRDNNG
jgi:hypothetical protein